MHDFAKSRFKLFYLWALLPLPWANADSRSPTTTAKPSSSTSDKARNFYEVLEDVLGDFEFDLKNANVGGLKDVSIRNVALSENVPPSFKNHIDLLITEKIIKTTKTKVIQCLPCRAKKTTLNGDQITISGTDTNQAELMRIAKATGIEHFLDIAFAYQPAGIVLSLYTIDPDGNIIWSRTYNSETSRAAAFRRGVDYTQIDEARKVTEYQPALQYRVTIYYLFEPNFSSITGCIGAGFRMVERYDNRKKEVGFEANYLKDSSTIVGSSTSTTKNLYSGINLTLLFIHAWNMIGEEENFNKVRGSLLFGMGGTYASGFLGALARAQYEWRLGKHYATSLTLGYRPSSTAFISGSSAGSISGPEFGVGINMFF